tara:strand:- start:389 stop:736 length:348 start_codon:yes stop_codon:yes gene_type:complete
MVILNKILFLLILLLTLMSLGCKANTLGKKNYGVVRQAENAPEMFKAPIGVSLDKSSCKNPMVDPLDGTHIIMVSAKNSKGTYRVPSNKYGLAKGEFLRLDCQTGKVLGIVKRKD